jgi:chromosome segregation ATPase
LHTKVIAQAPPQYFHSCTFPHSHDHARMEISEHVNHIHRLQEALQHERQVGVNSTALFDALRAELQGKERELTDQAKRSKEATTQLNRSLTVARKAVEDMAEKLVRVEEDKSALEVYVHKLTGQLNEARQEATASTAEVKRWSGMYADLEKVLSTVKAQTTTAQQGYLRDISNLQSELAQRSTELEAAKLELSAHLSSLTSIAGDMASITAMRAPTSLNMLHHHRTEVLATVRSLKRFVSKLSEPSLVTELYRKMVSFVEEVTVRMLSYHEGLLEWSQSSSEESKRALGLEQSTSSLQRDLGYADAAAEKLISMLQSAGFLYTVNASELKAANMGAAKAEALGSEVCEVSLSDG